MGLINSAFADLSCMKPRPVEGVWSLKLIDLIHHVLISGPDPQAHLRGCESKRDYRLRLPADMGLEVVYNAIKIGYRLLDGAGDYGNEKEAGEGVRRAIADGLVKREDLCRFSGILAQNRTSDQFH